MDHCVTRPSADDEIRTSPFSSPVPLSRSVHFNCQIGPECLPGLSLDHIQYGKYVDTVQQYGGERIFTI